MHGETNMSNNTQLSLKSTGYRKKKNKNKKKKKKKVSNNAKVCMRIYSGRVCNNHLNKSIEITVELYWSWHT